MTPVLYSTNVYLKLFIHQQYRKDIHYVWCSEYFDSELAPTSNPKDIFWDLMRAVEKEDSHCYKISEQKLSLITRSLEWKAKGEITNNQRKEIIHRIKNSSFKDWRPIIYLIPYKLVESRLRKVKLPETANLGNEFVIKDLKRNEFGIIDIKRR